MSNTPRTDAAELEANIGVTHFDHKDLSAAYHFARQLERELTASNAIIRQQQLLDEANLRLQERIKRLEEAGNQMELVLISFQIFSDFRKSDSIRATLNWNKTKEAKP